MCTSPCSMRAIVLSRCFLSDFPSYFVPKVFERTVHVAARGRSSPLHDRTAPPPRSARGAAPQRSPLEARVCRLRESPSARSRVRASANVRAALARPARLRKNQCVHHTLELEDGTVVRGVRALKFVEPVADGSGRTTSWTPLSPPAGGGRPRARLPSADAAAHASRYADDDGWATVILTGDVLQVEERRGRASLQGPAAGRRVTQIPWLIFQPK